VDLLVVSGLEADIFGVGALEALVPESREESVPLVDVVLYGLLRDDDSLGLVAGDAV